MTNEAKVIHMICRQPLQRSALRPAIVAAATLALVPLAGAAPEPPQRRPGLWRISTISPEVGMQTNDVCIEADDSLIGSAGGDCAAPIVESANDQWIVTLSCDRAGGREVTSLLFTGDFTGWYRAQAKVTFTRADGKARPGSGFTIDAKFLGPDCPKDR
jgi:hypothetical protein